MLDRIRLRLAVQVALLTNVTAAVRAICVDLAEGTVRLTVYFERSPTSQEEEMLFDAAVETAGDFPENLDAAVDCLVDARPMAELMGALKRDPKGYLVYARHEDGYG